MKKNGFILPVVLLLLSLMLGIYSQVTTILPSLIKKHGLLYIGNSLVYSVKNNLLFINHNQSANRLDCEGRTLVKGNVSYKGNLCLENNSVLKFLKFNPISKIDCTDQTAPLNRFTLTGVQLSDNSQRSPRVCLELPSFDQNEPPGNRIINGNFESIALINLSTDIIFSGYVNITHGISIASDVGILAVGDIRVDTISSASPLPIKLYLHSRSGQIQIGAINGNITVHCTSKAHNCNGNGGNIYWAPTTTSLRRAIYFE